MTMNKKIIPIAVAAVLATASQVASAALPVKVSLNSTSGAAYVCNADLGTPPASCSFGTNVTSGSWFGMDGSGDGSISVGERVRIDMTDASGNPTGPGGTGIYDFNNLTAATGGHTGPIDGSENPVSDIWEFFGGVGMHFLTAPMVDNKDGTIDMSGWTVNWNTVNSAIPMGGDGANNGVDTGVATIVCVPADCSAGATYTLDYSAHVPLGDASGFGGVLYELHQVGVVVDNNLAPVATASPFAAAMAPSTTIIIDITGNVSDPDGDGVDFTTTTLSYLDADGRGATVVNNNDGTFSYTDTVNTDTVSPDRFSYTVADTLGKVSASFDVDVTITTAAIPPQTQPFSVLTHKDVSIDVDVLAQTTVGDNPFALTNAVNVTIEKNGTTSINPSTGVVTFTPASGITRPTTADFTYTVDDDQGNTSLAAKVTVTVNDPPVAGNTTVSVDRNSSVLVDVVFLPGTGDSDGTVDPTTVLAIGDSHGTASADTVTGKVTYTPTPGDPYKSTAQFTYTIQDNDGATSNPAGVVSVNIVNALPVAVDDIVLIDTSSVSSINIDVTANDTDSDGTIDITSVINTDPTKGTATLNTSTGVITYAPNAGAVGSDTLQYTVNDNDGGGSSPATVSITISTGTDFCSKAPLAADQCFLQFNSGKSTGVTPVLGDGSYFTMEVQPGVPAPTFLAAQTALQLNTTQPASTGPLVPNLDQPWLFFGNLGVHQTTSAPTVKADDGAGHVIFDFTGWDVSWNRIASIPLGAGAHSGGVEGEAVMTCYADDLVSQTPGDCSAGNVYVLDYYATVPVGDPSGFGGVKYRLHLEGKVAISGVVFSPVVPPNTTDIQAIDGGGNPATVKPGSAASVVNNPTGTNLSAADVGVNDPLFNPKDGEQCAGGCVDFVVTGFTGDYADIIFRLNKPLPDGAVYRKLINGIWSGFDTSGDDQLGSNAEVAGACTDDQFSPGLLAGYQCVFMRIYDGGSNDADGVKNGTIVDPSGALVAGSPNTPAGSTSGCSISSTNVDLTERADWLIVAGFIAWLGLIGYRRNKTVN